MEIWEPHTQPDWDNPTHWRGYITRANCIPVQAEHARTTEAQAAKDAEAMVTTRRNWPTHTTPFTR